MKTSNYERIKLIIDFLTQLKIINDLINSYSSQLEKESVETFQKYSNEKICEIENEINNFKNNIEVINKLNNEKLFIINEWFTFSKDENQIKSLSYPIKIFFGRRKIKNKIKQINEQIASIAIKNRFLMEKIKNWQNEVEKFAFEKLLKSESSVYCKKLLEIRKTLIEDLNYLMSSMSETKNIYVTQDNIDSVILTLKNKIAA